MLCQSCVPYRGYGIQLTVTELEIASFNGAERRFTVVWSINREGPLANIIASFPEPVEFTSSDEALRYAEGRAHTFVDCTIAVVEK